MSASLSKKKLSQQELRKYMQQHKYKEKLPLKKIESPLAKYNDQGQLTCVLCKSIVRSEAVWNVHVNAKQHKDNVELAKKLKERTNNFTTPLKRPLTPPLQVSATKPKSILKNGNSTSKVEEVNKTSQADGEPSKSELPKDFFDSSSGNKIKTNQGKKHKVEEKPGVDQMLKESGETLPEGFFDDPKLDAKARNIEYKDPIQEEWEKFQKEIRDVEGESAAIIAEDQDEATTERQMDEIDEQIKNFSKVMVWEKRKAEVAPLIDEAKHKEVVEDDEEVEMDLDEAFDWRSKNPYK